MATFSFESDKTADGKPSLGFEPNDKSWKYQLSGRIPILLTASPLGVSSVYTQDSVDSMAYPQDNSVAGHVYANQSGTLYLDVSADNTNWDVQTSSVVSAGIPAFLPFTAIQGRYYRFRYVNGNTAQTAFRLEQIQANQLGSGNSAAGTKTDSAVTDPTLSASEISLLKGLMQQLQGTGIGAAPVTLTGSNMLDSQAIPVRNAGLEDFLNGSVTVTAAQVELKAGATPMNGRKQMIVYPPSAGVIYWGKTGVTAANGAPLAAGDAPLIFDFNPSQALSIYAVNDGTDRQIKVVESK